MSALGLGIVIPTLNAAETVSATIESLRPALAAGAQIIVVDGGSTDGTLAIVDNQSLRVEHCPSGLYASLNVGFRLLSTEWLTWINADDLLYSDRLALRIERAAGSSVIYGPVDFIDEAGRFIHSWTSAAPTNLLALFRAGYSPLLQQGTLFRSDVFAKIGGFDESYRLVGDADFWWRALEAGYAFSRTTHPTVAAFRLHVGQLTQRHAKAMHREHLQMVSRHGGRTRTLRSWLALCRFRAGNITSYAIRGLRRRDLEGAVRLPGSYEVVKTD